MRERQQGDGCKRVTVKDERDGEDVKKRKRSLVGRRDFKLLVKEALAQQSSSDCHLPTDWKDSTVAVLSYKCDHSEFGWDMTLDEAGNNSTMSVCSIMIKSN